MKKLRLSNAGRIARWEFLKTLRSPTFLILTFIMPLLIIGGGIVGYFTEHIAEGEELNIAVIDKTGDFYPFLKQQLANDSNLTLSLHDSETEKLKEKVAENEYDGFLVFDREILIQTGQVPYYVSDMRNINMSVLRNTISYPITVYRLQQLDLSEEQIASATIPVEIMPQLVSGEEPGLAEFVAPLALAMGLIFAVIFTGQVLMYGVIKEKKNRIVEIILSSISSLELMMGKVLGFGALGLLQIIIWTSVGLAVANYFWDIGVFISLREIIPSLFVFLFGYMLLASLFAGVGATMKDAEGGSQIQGLVILIPMIPLFVSGPLILSPDAVWARVLSYLPPFSPVTSLLRIGASTLPAWELVSIIAVLIVSALLFIYIGSRLFEGAILQYDRTISFKDVRGMLK